MPRWLLPEGIADVLPAEARRIEDLRRRLLDLFEVYGYELVIPPLIEHLDALLVGAGRDLSRRMFQTVDQLSGRTLAVRADMTPQVARIDAHLLNRSHVVRLCYAGSVLHTRAQGALRSREPIQVGCEIYGHTGLEADLEILDLMMRAIAMAGGRALRLDLCPVGIVGALLAQHGLAPELQERVHDLMLAKNRPALRESLSDHPALARTLCALTALHGDLPRQGSALPGASLLDRAQEVLADLPALPAVLETLRRIAASRLWQEHPQVQLSVDFADMRGWQYHTGLTFAAYVEGHPAAIARGGRYDNVGASFGRARPATGFSLELRELAALGPEATVPGAIRAPWSDDGMLRSAVAALRAQGEIVVQVMPGHEDEHDAFVCDRELQCRGGAWLCVARSASPAHEA